MSADDRMPDRLGPYRLLDRIGEGGMGVVYLARDAQQRTVAVKVLRPGVAGEPNAVRRLAREVETMRRVRSPYVAEVVGADLTGDLPYIATRYVPGRTLDQVVAAQGPLRGTALAGLARGLADALAAVHAAGVVHRDLKPGNVMLVGGSPVVIDFGIAQGPEATRLTMTGMFMGTPGYLAPEVIEGQPSSEASDVHAWGATVAFAATGRPPYGTGPYETIFYKIVNGQPSLEGTPPALLPLLAAAMARDPAHRPPAIQLSAQAAVIDPAVLVPAPAVAAGNGQPGPVTATLADLGRSGQPLPAGGAAGAGDPPGAGDPVGAGVAGGPAGAGGPMPGAGAGGQSGVGQAAGGVGQAAGGAGQAAGGAGAWPAGAAGAWLPGSAGQPGYGGNGHGGNGHGVDGNAASAYGPGGYAPDGYAPGSYGPAASGGYPPGGYVQADGAQDDYADVLPPVAYPPAVRPGAGAAGGWPDQPDPGLAAGGLADDGAGASPRGHALLAGASMLVLVCVSVLLPVAGTAVALALIALLRAGEGARAAAIRRWSRGTRPSDPLVAAVSFPWFLVRSLLGLLAWSPVAAAAAVLVAGITMIIVQVDRLPHAIAYGAGALVAFYGLGPASARPRHQLSHLYARVTRTRIAQAVALIAVSALAVGAVTAAATWPPLYSPAHPPTSLIHLGYQHTGPFRFLPGRGRALLPRPQAS